MKKLTCSICDQCSKVIKTLHMDLTRKSKKGKILDFCSQECFDKSAKPKPRIKKDKLYQNLIHPDEAALFIDESNRIEEIILPRIDALAGWMAGKSKHAEIDGQVKALRFMFDKFAKTPLTVEVVCKLHTILMDGLLQPYELGIRREHVQIGGKLCPAPANLKYMLERWCEKVGKFDDKTTAHDIWNAHLAYEKIHPFIDGNGRSGRLLWLWLLYKHGFPFSYVESATKYEEYYPQFGPFSFEGWVQA